MKKLSAPFYKETSSGPVLVRSTRNWVMTLYRVVGPTWIDLRGIGNSATIKMTVLIPVVGYLLLFNDKLRERRIFDLWTEISGRAEAHSPPWRLFALYFGLTAMAIGSLIYALRCPREIKRYGNEIDYIADMEAHASSGMRWALETRVMKDPVMAPVERRYMPGSFGSPDEARRSEDAAKIDYWRDLFSVAFRRLDRERALSRYLAAAFYGIGIILVAIPSVSAFVHIALYFVDVISR